MYLTYSRTAIVGYKLQQLQQSQTDRKAKVEKEIAESTQREEALQNYLDRLSELLVDKKLIAMEVNLQKLRRQQKTFSQADQESKDIVEAAKDVIRARTLSILRMLGQDGERKGSVMKFLIEAHAIGKLKLDLSGADLSDANLSSVNLSGANLKDTNLSGANLKDANLFKANLFKANLCGAKLSGAILVDSKLMEANLRDADLKGASIRDADLSKAELINADLTNANLSPWGKKSGAKLIDTNLHNAILRGANLQDVYLYKARNLTDAQIKSSLNWDKAIHTEADRDIGHQPWIVRDKQANQMRIEKIRTGYEINPTQQD